MIHVIKYNTKYITYSNTYDKNTYRYTISITFSLILSTNYIHTVLDI
jgi:hypothetical protein